MGYAADGLPVAGSLDPECERVYKQLKIRRKHRFLVMRIDPTSEAIVIETIGARDAAIAARRGRPSFTFRITWRSGRATRAGPVSTTKSVLWATS